MSFVGSMFVPPTIVAVPFAGVEDIRAAYRFTRLQDFLDIYYQGAGVLQTEQDFHDIKEVWGAGQQQVRTLWANIGCYHLNLWSHTLVEFLLVGALVLLLGAGLMLRSLDALMRIIANKDGCATRKIFNIGNPANNFSEIGRAHV